MKKKQLKENKNKTAEELGKLVIELKSQLEKLMMEILAGKNKNLRALRSLRKDIAQILTIINQKKGK